MHQNLGDIDRALAENFRFIGDNINDLRNA